MAKAIGEGVERYCAAFYESEELPFYPYASAPFRCVSPSQFALYTPSQYAEESFPYRSFTSNTPVRWAPATDLVTGETIHLPASMVFVPYLYERQRDEDPIAQPISTGLACHCSRAEVAIAAISEVIERDAFSIMWQARLSMPHIILETLSNHNREVVSRFERTGASVTLLNITMDSDIATILAVLRHEGLESPALAFAPASHPDPEQAVRKSLEELELTRRLAQKVKFLLPTISWDGGFENVVSQNDHVRLFCDQMNFGSADFVFASNKRVEFGSLPKLSTGQPVRTLEMLTQRITNLGHQILLADLTTPDIRSLGLSVARAVIPGFHPLFFGHRLRALGGSRLWEVPRKLGYAGIVRESGDNPIPHPCP